MRTTIACALGLAAGACGPTGRPASTGPANQDPATGIGATLRHDVGAGVPVAIVPGADGLRAISADGARQRTLVPGAVPWALVDARADVVWFGSADGADVLVLDLEGDGTPETVVSGLPTQTDGGTPELTIVYDVEGGPPDTLTVGHPITPHVELHVTAAPYLTVDGGILAMWEQEGEFDASVQQATLVGKDRIAALAARNTAGTVDLGFGDSAPRVDVPMTDCEDPDECGLAETVPPTKLLRVVVSNSCGDGCYRTFKLYDPATRTFFDQEWGTWAQDAWVAPDGSAFVTWGMVVRFDTGPLAATPPGEDGPTTPGGGWLGGGYYLGQ